MFELKANSWPLFPGLQMTEHGYKALGVTPAVIDKALEELRLEDAKMAIYDLYGVYSIKTQKNLFRIVQKLVDLNAQALAPEHVKLKYTLEAAYELGCTLYTNANNQRRNEASMHVAIDALRLVAEAYEKKNDYQKAIHALVRLDSTPFRKNSIQKVLDKWQTYIDGDCPDNEKAIQACRRSFDAQYGCK